MISFGNVPASSVLPIVFDSFAGSTGASITITGLAVTDIEVYKGTSMTQRASDAGYVLMDTDGIDLDGVTGIQGFSLDLGDNTDAGFYAVGSFYWVVVSAVTVDGQTVNFVAATFRIVAAEAIAGKPEVDVHGLLGTAWLAPGTAGTPDVNAKLWNGLATVALPATPTNITAGTITTTTNVTNDVGITQAAADKVFGASGAVLPELAQAAPAATPSPRAAMMLLYMALRNLVQVTATEKRVSNDAGTIISKKTLSDDGTTYAETEMVSGP